MDLREAKTEYFLSQLQQRIRGRNQSGPDGTVAADNALIQLEMLLDLAERCRANAASLGAIPPTPNTLRGRVGAFLVRIVRRMLFWYTPQIASQNMLVAESLAETVQELRRISSHLSTVREAAGNATSRVDRQETSAQEILAAQRQLGENLDAIQREAAVVQRETMARLFSLDKRQGELEQWLAAQISLLDKRQDELEQRLAAQISSLDKRQDELDHRKVTQQLWEAAGSRLDNAERSLLNLRREVMLQQQRLAVIINEARRNNAEGLSNSGLAGIASETDHFQDALYASFEDVFRGAREDIKDCLRVYLPRLQEAGAGWPDAPALDLGCGRGEWLELLRGERLEVTGVDSNRIFIQECRERGLNVIEGDALSYMRSVRDASLGAVTAFHLVEHVPLPVLLALLDETVRVLKPGGIAIFETPNPANILVGANNFYYDPTHRNPLPSLLLSFLAEARGLTRVEVLPLHPVPDGVRLPNDGSEVVRRFNDYFYGPQDYAVIGYRA